MIVINKQTVKISPEELKSIIIDHLKHNGIHVSSVCYKIGAHEDPNDWSASLPLTHTLDEIICE